MSAFEFFAAQFLTVTAAVIVGDVAAKAINREIDERLMQAQLAKLEESNPKAAAELKAAAS